ncbi:hypothetical protein DMA11_07460 [Marinilabiliaceae bacterium JC017]|nr:hypothetical protein DMA11_07460 [Marinilabiliaceae bacterium JC017]
MKPLKLPIILCLIILAATACIDWDLDKISDKLDWEPNVSFPVGELIFKAKDDVVTDLPKDSESTLDEMEIRDTLSFDFDDLFDVRENVENILFRLNIENHYPGGGKVEILYLSESKEIIGSLTKENPIILDPAEMNEDGTVKAPYKTREDIDLSDDEIDELIATKELLVLATLYDVTLTPAMLNHFKDYKLLTQIGVQAQLSISTNN